MSELDPTAAEMPDTAPDAGAPAAEAAQREIEKLKAENLRLIAEQRNITQRNQRELSERLRYAEIDFARDLLVPLDDLKRVIDSPTKEPAGAPAVEGARLAYEAFVRCLRARGIEPIPAEGKAFDPAVHEALVHQPHDLVPAGDVIQEVAVGYRMNDRVIRPTRVIVSSGPATCCRAGDPKSMSSG